MRNFMEAYTAVHSKEAKEELNSQRDPISEMNTASLQDNDLRELAEEVLEELRCCPPAPGYESVEIPGEREREHREKSAGIVSIPKETWDQILDLHDSLNSSS